MIKHVHNIKGLSIPYTCRYVSLQYIMVTLRVLLAQDKEKVKL